MKKVAFAILGICLISQAQPALDQTVLAVEKELNSLFSDTFNKGETHAEVLRVGKVPQINCSKIIYTKGRKVVFCTAEIKTSIRPSLKNHGSATCTSLGYVLDNKGKIESDFNPEQNRKCMETINDSSYE